jgi:hypothetical protein
MYDLDIKPGDWSPVRGKAYYATDAKVAGNAFKQEANFVSKGTIVAGIYGKDSTVTFEGIAGTRKPQWVAFYYQTRTACASVISRAARRIASGRVAAEADRGCGR